MKSPNDLSKNINNCNILSNTIESQNNLIKNCKSFEYDSVEIENDIDNDLNDIVYEGRIEQKSHSSHHERKLPSKGNLRSDSSDSSDLSTNHTPNIEKYALTKCKNCSKVQSNNHSLRNSISCLEDNVLLECSFCSNILSVSFT